MNTICLICCRAVVTGEALKVFTFDFSVFKKVEKINQNFLGLMCPECLELAQKEYKLKHKVTNDKSN